MSSLLAEKEPGGGHTARQRLTVHEMQVALAAARTLASPEQAGSTASIDSAEAPRGHTGRGHQDDILEMDLLDTDAETRAGAQTPAGPDPRVPQVGAGNEPWLPEHDGPVSLAGAAAPRAPQRRTPARIDATSRATRPARKAAKPHAVIVLARDRLADCRPPRLVLLPAAGGGGGSSLAVLLASALAPVHGALIVGPAGDAGALSARAGAVDGDWDLLAVTARRPGGLHADDTGHVGTGLGYVDTGEAIVLVAAPTRRTMTCGVRTAPSDMRSEEDVLAAALRFRQAVVVDCPDLWSSFTQQALAAATHVAVIAPQTPAGLVDTDFAVHLAEAQAPAGVSMVVVAVDVRGRVKSRATRAALSRARALPAPVMSVPFDPRLADATGVDWLSLRVRTQAAVMAVLTQSLLGKDS